MTLHSVLFSSKMRQRKNSLQAAQGAPGLKKKKKRRNKVLLIVKIGNREVIQRYGVQFVLRQTFKPRIT